MSTNLITGYAGKSHITSAGDGAVNAAILGTGRYVLDVAEKFAYELISNNQIRIKSGYAIDQGRKIELAVNDYEELIIDNGLQGVKRCDLVAITYEKNLETGIETATMNIINGTSGDDYIDPEHTSGDIIVGDVKDDFLLYRLKINGLSIEAVEPLFKVRKSFVEMDTAENTTAFTSSDVADGSASSWTSVSKLSSDEKHSSIFAKMSQMFKNVRYLYKMLGTTDISKIGNGTCTGAISSLNDGLKKYYTQTEVDNIIEKNKVKSIVIEFAGATTNENKAFFPKYTYWGYVGGKTTEIDNLIAQGHTILGGFICGGPHNDASMAGNGSDNIGVIVGSATYYNVPYSFYVFSQAYQTIRIKVCVLYI